MDVMQLNIVLNLFWTLFYNADHCDVLELTGDAVDAGRGLVDSAVALEVKARAGYCRCSSMISKTQMLCQLSILAFLFKVDYFDFS